MKRFDAIIYCIFGLCLAHSLWVMSIGWNNTILDMHGFRQTQTAISVYYLLKGGRWLAYETPVLGAPWSIPFEFPLYQWIVALVVKLTALPIDQGGRLVSILFFYLCLVPAYMFLGCLRVPRVHRFIFLSLFLASPIYLFWSRTFMIESTAFFLSLSFLAAVGRYFDKQQRGYFVLAVFLGIAGALVKITTFFGFALAGGFYFCAVLLKKIQRREDVTNPSKLICFVLLPVVGFAVIPVLCVSLWVHFADLHKLEVPLAAKFITSVALQKWNFGSLDQKLSVTLWKNIILGRVMPDILGSSLIPFISLLLLPLMKHHKRVYLISIFVFFAVIFVFTNLHFEHNYYQYANALFVLVALGFCIVSLLEQNGAYKILGSALLILTLYRSLFFYYQNFYPVAKTNNLFTLEVSEAIRKNTQPNEVILIYGDDWNPRIPYYSQRRAIMDRQFRQLCDPDVQETFNNVSGQTMGAVAFCLGIREDRNEIRHRVKDLDLQPRPFYHDGACEVYLPSSRAFLN